MPQTSLYTTLTTTADAPSAPERQITTAERPAAATPLRPPEPPPAKRPEAHIQSKVPPPIPTAPDPSIRANIATSREAANTIRELRERQTTRASLERETEEAPKARVDQSRLPSATVVPAAFVPTRPEDPTPRDPQPQIPALPDSRETQPAPAQPALVASTRARLLCAMPRTGGQTGSDIVLLGHTRNNVHRLIDDGTQNMSPVLSPDGSQLAYTSYRGGVPNVYLRNLISGQDRQLTSGPWLALPGTWSPNGRYLSLSQSIEGNHDIFLYDVMQQRLRRLTQHPGIDVSPSFAPDSQRLVFSSDRTGAPQLYLTDTTGASAVRLTQTGTYNTSPSWSPRDDLIAFIGRSPNRSLDLYTIKPDGSQRQRLTQGQRFHAPPAWLPDGNTLMGMSLRGAAWERHLIQLNPDRTIPSLPEPKSLCLAPQWVAYRVR